jgi:putative peptidoglycan lipid II flippase
MTSPANAGALAAPGGRLRRLLAGDSANRRMLRAALAVGGFSLLAKLAMGAQDLALAWRFGTGDAMDALVMATAAPAFLWAVTTGALESAFIPAYVRVRERGSGGDDAMALFRAVASRMALVFALCAAALALAAPWLPGLLAPAFDAAKRETTATLGLLLAPTVLFRGLSSVGRSLLNAHESFVAPALAPACAPLAALAALWFAPEWGVTAVAAGMAAGAMAELAVVAWRIRARGLRLAGRRVKAADARAVWRQYLPIIAGSSLVAATTLVDQLTAARLEAGSVATLSFGSRVALLVSALPALALGTAAMPQFSRLIAIRDWGQVRHTLATWSGLVWKAAIPAVGLLILFSPALVRLVFERGAFSAEDTARVAAVQSVYLLQAPFYLAGVLGSRLLSALLWNDALLAISAASLALKAGLNVALAPRFGVTGVAAATVLMYAFSCAGIYACLGRRLREQSN